MNRKSRLPPLKALHAFTAAAGHLSFAKAAEDLCVTAAAVSYQVRLLERVLGTALFHRRARGLELTRQGRTLHAATEAAFGDLVEVVEMVRSGAEPQDIRLASVPHFSASVLMPGRLKLMESHPQLSLSVDYTLGVPDFSQGGHHFAVLFGKGEWPGLKADLLFRSPTAPACAPSTIEREGIAAIEDLRRVPVLLDHNCFHDIWVDWYAAAGLGGWEKLRFIQCNDIHALITSAVAGYGVVMEPDFVIESQLATGALRHPFAARLMNYGYYLVYPEDVLRKQSCRLFRDWLVGFAMERGFGETPVLPA